MRLTKLTGRARQDVMQRWSSNMVRI